MKIRFFSPIVCVYLTVALLSFYGTTHAENIDPGGDGSRYVYGENIGWISLEPNGNGGPGVEVGDNALSGYMWGENTGWINLSPPNGGVVNDGLGHLSGYAWGENTGWINFAPAFSGVTIDPDTGLFSGHAWGENIGWISFQGTAPLAFQAKTAWRATPPALSINDTTTVEGNTGTTDASFTVTLSRASSQTITVAYATADGTATTADNDYAAASGTLSFAPGETSKSVTVSVNGDTRHENNETFYLNLTNPFNATIADGQGTGTITDDDAAIPTPALIIDDVTVAEGNAGTTDATFTVTLSRASSQTITVAYATADGTATTADNDYTAVSGALNFAPGETSKSVTVSVNGDTRVENDEIFYLNLTNPVNATIADGQGTGTITNDDAAPPSTGGGGGGGGGPCFISTAADASFTPNFSVGSGSHPAALLLLLFFSLPLLFSIILRLHGIGRPDAGQSGREE